MRFITVGVGPEGRSRIVEDRELARPPMEAGANLKADMLWSTSQLPPELPVPRHAIDGNWMNTGLAAGASRWLIVNFPAGNVTAMHHSSTLDYDMIIAGETTLGTEEGEVLMRAGDCAMVPGAMHSWTAGPEGCTMACIILGLADAG